MTSPKRSTWSYPWLEAKKTPLGAHLFSTVDRSCVKLFLFSTVLLNITFLTMFFFWISMGKREQCECCKWKESRWRRGVKRGDANELSCFSHWWYSPMFKLLFDVYQCSPVFCLLNIVYFPVCLTSNKLYRIEDQLADVSTRFYTSASWSFDQIKFNQL